jgi:hypothetical protein
MGGTDEPSKGNPRPLGREGGQDTLKAGDIVERVMKEFEALGGLELVKGWGKVSTGQRDLDGDWIWRGSNV